MEVWIDGAWMLSILIGCIISVVLVYYYSIGVNEGDEGFFIFILTIIFSVILANFVF